MSHIIYCSKIVSITISLTMQACRRSEHQEEEEEVAEAHFVEELALTD